MLLKQKSQMLASQLGIAEVREVKNNRLTLAYPMSGTVNRQIVEKSDNLSLITDLLREHFKANLSITFEIDQNKKGPTAELETNGRSSEDMKKLVEDSPHIKKLMEKVDGEIIGVRKID